MNYITMPYYFDDNRSHYLPITWIMLDKKTKFFTYHDILFTINIRYSKNNCKVLIHNTRDFLIYSHTTITIRDAISYVNAILDTVVNRYFFNDNFDIGYLHDLDIYSLYNLSWEADGLPF